MKSILIGLMALFAMTIPVAAANHPTPQQLAQFIHDTSCSHTANSISCANKTPGTVIVKLPDGTLVTLVSPETAAHGGNHGDGVCPPFQHAVNNFNPPFCVAIGGVELAGLSGNPAVYKTTTIPGGTRTDPTCTVSSASLTYTGGNPLNVNNYNFSTSGPTTSNGAC